MDDLKQYIIGHKDSFEEHEPPEFDWNKVNRKRKGFKMISLKRLAIAASIMAVLFTGLKLYNNETKEIRLTDLQTIYPEYAKAEDYYTQTIKRKLSGFEEQDYKLRGIGADIKNELQLKNDIYKHLYQSLQENPQNERVAGAIIEYYKAKLDLINSLESQLNIAKTNIKKMKNEKRNI